MGFVGLICFVGFVGFVGSWVGPKFLPSEKRPPKNPSKVGSTIVKADGLTVVPKPGGRHV